jgi:hypothetical protein
VDKQKLVEFLRNLVESQAQAVNDFCGEQRDWHLPRLNRCFMLAVDLFPAELTKAMMEAETPYGDRLVG